MKPYYRVVLDKDGCPRCNNGAYWTICDEDDVAIGTSWMDREFADDICALMNMAFEDGKELACRS